VGLKHRDDFVERDEGKLNFEHGNSRKMVTSSRVSRSFLFVNIFMNKSIFRNQINNIIFKNQRPLVYPVDGMR
jgi:hypothetical protein